MDKNKKLVRLIEVLNEWLEFSILWTKVEVSLFLSTKVERANTVTRRGVDKNGMEYDYSETVQWVDKISPTEFIKVRYCEPKEEWKSRVYDQRIVFPADDLDKRLEHYENKVKYLKEKLTKN